MRSLFMLLDISTGNMNRRSALRTIGAGIVVGLAGCSESNNNSTSSETLTSSQFTSSSTRTATSEETPTPEETPAQSPKSVSVNISELTGSHTYADVDPQRSRLYPDITGPQSPVGEVWTGFDFPTPFLNLFQNNNIYAATSGGVGAYDATTGTQQWAVELETRSSPLAAVAGKVILEDGTIISQSDGSIERQLTGDVDAVSKDSIYTYSYEKYLRKFDLRTGSEQWRVKHPRLISAVIYENNLVFYDVSGKNDGLNIFDLSNKSQERIGGELDEEGYTYQLIGVQNGICAVFAPRRKGGTRTTRIIGIEITSGERLWDKQLAKNVFTDYRFTAGSRVYAMTPNEVVVVSVNRNDSDIIKPVVQSYSLEDGSLRWNTELPSLGKNINNLQVYKPSVLITSKSVYVSQLSYDSGISAKTFVLNRSNGSIQIDHTGYTTMIMDSAMFGFKITDSDSTRSVLWAESD